MFEHIELPQNPIFIVGNARSGTTLLQALIATQENVYSFRETHFFTRIKPRLDVESSGCISGEGLQEGLDAIKEFIDLEFPEEERQELHIMSEKKMLSGKVLFEIIVFKLLKMQNAKSHSSFVWLEKTPAHSMHVDEIFDYYPNARVIHIVRNPVAVVYSTITKFPFIKKDDVEFWANVWHLTERKVEKYKNYNNFYTIKYEALVDNVEIEIEKICKFLRIDFNADSILKYYDEAYKVILEKEKWKEGVLQKAITNNNQIAFDKLSHWEIMKIYCLTKNKSIQYGYLENNYSIFLKFIFILGLYKISSFLKKVKCYLK